ncbi:hypothetical protein SAMN04487843_12339 [Methylobacterium sp. ap11]|uniref:hypothetical protein n=1 Tax=Methylobacterium sp. ap11 TaxID=1761799 RepID=UPI0008D1EC80|nr:hypothetical protein [Methylobacterium sp. ap11]SEP46266.1 hypothetical protein SAMN04487843_12339 [Methylobacterium sp. ap11]
MTALLAMGSIGLKLGILVAVALGSGAVGYRLGRDLDVFLSADRSPARRARRLVDRIAVERGLARGDLLRAMLEEDARSTAGAPGR